MDQPFFIHVFHTQTEYTHAKKGWPIIQAFTIDKKNKKYSFKIKSCNVFASLIYLIPVFELSSRIQFKSFSFV